MSRTRCSALIFLEKIPCQAKIFDANLNIFPLEKVCLFAGDFNLRIKKLRERGDPTLILCYH